MDVIMKDELRMFLMIVNCNLLKSLFEKLNFNSREAQRSRQDTAMSML